MTTAHAGAQAGAAPIGAGASKDTVGRSMREFALRFKPFFVYAGVFSLVINVLMLAPALFMIQVFDRVVTSRSVETLVMLGLVTLVALGFIAFLDVIRARLLAGMGISVEKILGPRIIGEIVKRASAPSSTEASHGLRDVSLLRAFLTGPAIVALFDAPWVPIYVLIIVLFHPLLGLVAIIGAGLMLLIAYLNERLTRQVLGEMQTSSRAAGRFADQTLRNAEVIGAMGMGENLVRAWQALSGGALAMQYRASSASSVLSSLSRFLRQFLQIAMLFAGAWLVISHSSTTGVMIAATILLARALAPVETAIAGWKTLVDARGAYERLNQTLETSPLQKAQTELEAPRGELSAERVIFGFRGQDQPVIKGATFRVEPGEVLAIVGPSAAGKSTLARLLVGMWKPQSGVVRIDGADIALWPRESLGPYIGYLPQDVELFAGTVSHNIARLGDLDSTAVIKAAQRANAHELILRLPLGYDTPIGEGGASLSAGQRQRVALARALYHDPRLLVLDEPNSNLDADGENALSQALLGLKADGVTMVVVTHRPALLAVVDKVMLLRNGMVEKFGTLSEVLPPAIVQSIKGAEPPRLKRGAARRKPAGEIPPAGAGDAPRAPGEGTGNV